MDDVFALWHHHDTFAASTIVFKRRKLEDRIGAILCAQSGCDVTRALLREITKLLTFFDAPDLL
jgi:hypothetical protein